MRFLLVLLAGCMPVGMMRPVSPMGEGQHEEFGVSAVGAMPPQGYFPTSRIQAWVARQYSPNFDLAIFAFGGTHSYRSNWRKSGRMDLPDFGGGIDIRYFMLSNERVRIGGGLRAGWSWADISFPMAFRIGSKVWVETRPTFGYPLMAQIPVAVSIPASERWLVMPEFGYYYLEPAVTNDPLERHHYLYASVGLVYRYR